MPMMMMCRRGLAKTMMMPAMMLMMPMTTIMPMTTMLMMPIDDANQ
jgi:hypothetical protein